MAISKFMITGTRDPDDTIRTLVKFALGWTTYLNPKETDPAITLFQGEARGVDLWAKELWQGWGYPTKDFKADWNKYGNAAGGKRNQKMVDDAPELCLAFPGPESIGTWDAVRRAKQSNVLTFILTDQESMRKYYDYITKQLNGYTKM